MIRSFVCTMVLAAAALCGGCAHSITVGPDIAGLPRVGTDKLAKVAVAYYISAEDRARKVKTGGGGGDSAEYLLYQDLEPALYRVLSNRFAQVYALKAPDDQAFLEARAVRYVFTPRFSTTSSSSSLLTWPPTEFTLNIQARAVDRERKPVWETEVSGSGSATFTEFKSNFGLAAQRATTEAFLKLDAKLTEFPTAP